jgi:hypothetical protein
MKKKDGPVRYGIISDLIYSGLFTMIDVPNTIVNTPHVI